jgi:tocopherol cyclase
LLKQILNPDLYHGESKQFNFFEGWYFKVADRFGKNVFAFIPGISKGRDEKYHHSFIQVLDGRDKSYNYFKGREDDFKYSKEKFEIEVLGNSFSEKGMTISIDNEEKSVCGVLEFEGILKWPSTKLSPGSMGYYNYLTFMECYSQVTAMDGNVKGSLKMDGEHIDFEGGRVYIEKNWGREFPRAWVWIQSNEFEGSRVAFTCSIGRVPLGSLTFSGFLAGLYIDGQFYEFTKMNRAKMHIEKSGRDLKVVFKRKNLELRVRTESNREDFILCRGPRDGEMIPLVEECLNGAVNLELIDLDRDKTIYSGRGIATGIEYSGDMTEE